MSRTVWAIAVVCLSGLFMASPAGAFVPANVNITAHSLVDANGGRLERGDLVNVSLTVSQGPSSVSPSVAFTEGLTNLVAPTNARIDGVACGSCVASGNPPSSTLTGSFGNVAASSSKTLTFSAAVASQPASALAGADASISYFDSAVTQTRSSSASLTIATADLQLTSTSPPDTVLGPAGAQIPITFTVSNNGPDAATGVALLAQRPAGATGDPAVTVGDGPDADAAPDWLCDASANPVRCQYAATGAALASGVAAGAVSLLWTVGDVGSKDVSGNAAGDRFDPNSANGSQTELVEVAEAPPVATPPEPTAQCVVPQIKRGAKLAAAKRALVNAGCTAGERRRRHSKTVVRGRVIRLKPKPGTVLGAGAPVAIVLSSGA